MSRLIAISGSDGTGKSTAVREIVRALRDRGYAVGWTYCYGCVFCRRDLQPTSGSLRDSRLWRAVGAVHSLVDATELALRTTLARVRGQLRGRGKPVVVITDRGPLDGLAKFDPKPGSLAARMYTALHGRYDATLLLHAAPEVLAARDGEHSVPELTRSSYRYEKWARQLPSVVSIDTTDSPPQEVARQALVGVGRTGKARARVVLSIFDDAENSHYAGGGAVVVEKIATRLAVDFDVTVVTVGSRGGTQVRDGVRYRFLPIGWAGPRVGQLLFHALLPLLALRIRHALWIESFTPPFSTSFLPLFSRGRVLGLDQNLSGVSMWRRYRIPFFLIERLGLRFYRNVVVLNEHDREIVQRYSPRAAVEVIPNGVDLPGLDGSSLGYGDHILFLGRIDMHEKGLDLLIESYEKSGTQMPLIIAGSGTVAAEAKLAKTLARTTSDIRTAGRVTGTRKRELLQRSAFVVLPSRHETFGLSALEAMSYGKPVVHFDLPSLHWMSGGGNIAVPAFDVDALADAIGSLTADMQSRLVLGRRAWSAAQGFSWDAMTEHYDVLVHQLLDGGTP